nr:C1 family peptidase [Corallococcus sp. AS-1-6]
MRVDLRPWCSAVENQGNIGSCTANAVVGLYEYFQRRMTGENVEASRFFLYRATRRLLGWDGRGDTGAFIRSTIRALRLFGVPPEEYWPYNESDFDREPQAFQYAFAQNFRAIQYFRLEERIGQLKSALDAGLPFAFGFTCFSSMFTPDVDASGIIPYPSPQEDQKGGHAVLAVGYSDSHLLFKNSWGDKWGMGGYGFLPWTYFDRDRPLATDCWALLDAAIIPPEEAAPEDFEEETPGKQRVRRSRTKWTPPLIQVVRGSDPLAEVPLRITPLGVEAAHDGVRMGLRSTRGDVSVRLRRASITPSFDFTRLRQASDELYLVGLAWDLSSRPPALISSAAEPLKGVFHQDGAGREIRFGERGIQVWKGAPVIGALYMSLLLVEISKGAEAFTQALHGVEDIVKKSRLGTTLAGLESEAESLVRTEEAARLLLGEVTTALGEQGHVIPCFKGVFGADSFLQSQTDVYDQLGMVIELERALREEARSTPKPRLTALQQMQMALAEERQRGSRGVTEPPQEDVLPTKTQAVEPPKRPHGPRA